MPQNVYVLYVDFRVPMGGSRETYPSGRKYHEMDVLLLMQHKHRNHGLCVVATNNSNIPVCYEYQVTAT